MCRSCPPSLPILHRMCCSCPPSRSYTGCAVPALPPDLTQDVLFLPSLPILHRMCRSCPPKLVYCATFCKDFCKELQASGTPYVLKLVVGGRQQRSVCQIHLFQQIFFCVMDTMSWMSCHGCHRTVRKLR